MTSARSRRARREQRVLRRLLSGRQHDEVRRQPPLDPPGVGQPQNLRGRVGDHPKQFDRRDAPRGGGTQLVEQIARAADPGVAAEADALPGAAVRVEARAHGRGCPEEELIRRGTPDQAGPAHHDALPIPLGHGNAVHDDRVRPQAAEGLEPWDLVGGGGIGPLSGVHHERHVWRRRQASLANVSARLAARAHRMTFEREGMRPAVAPQDADRESPADLPIARIVMSDRRHARQEILQRADEQPRRERMALRGANRRVAANRRPQVVNPGRGVLVPVPPLQPTVVIQLEMIVRVDQTGQHERAAEIDDRVAPARRLADRQDAGSKPQRWREPLGCQHPCVDERDGLRPRQHHFASPCACRRACRCAWLHWNHARIPGFTA